MHRFLLPLVLFLAACGASQPTSPEVTPAAPPPATPATSHDPSSHDQMGTMKDASVADHADAPLYACPMHPDQTSTEPGQCPKCGMTMVLQEKHDHSTHDHGAMEDHTEGEHDDGEHH